MLSIRWARGDRSPTEDRPRRLRQPQTRLPAESLRLSSGQRPRLRRSRPFHHRRCHRSHRSRPFHHRRCHRSHPCRRFHHRRCHRSHPYRPFHHRRFPHDRSRLRGSRGSGVRPSAAAPTGTRMLRQGRSAQTAALPSKSLASSFLVSFDGQSRRDRNQPEAPRPPAGAQPRRLRPTKGPEAVASTDASRRRNRRTNAQRT